MLADPSVRYDSAFSLVLVLSAEKSEWPSERGGRKGGRPIAASRRDSLARVSIHTELQSGFAKVRQATRFSERFHEWKSLRLRGAVLGAALLKQRRAPA